MSKIYYPNYLTDTGINIQISFGYKHNISQRLSIGGFPLAEKIPLHPYGLFLNKNIFHPRVVKLKDLGNVYFYSRQLWVDFILSSKIDNLLSYESERGTKMAITHFLTINRIINNGKNQ